MTKNKLFSILLKLNLTTAVILLIIGLICHLMYKQSILASQILNIGVLYIILMPVIRVFMELGYFTKKRNYIYILVCISLIIVIAISIVC
ncbi:DUF1634 domain-containing protein [Francisella sp. Scap27]|uniref:DUF1634 domain-containing protein n=1 Tax=Francisella sp. Scap27 TaxID=2589986 RepID=UPI0015C158D9|nr:DUF1634 domain-containing protein [Francisella sp. Scap27]